MKPTNFTEHDRQVCEAKVSIETEAVAKRIAERMRKSNKRDCVRCYKCRVCGKWHTTSSKTNKRPRYD